MLRADVDGLALAQSDREWLPGLRPYVFQTQVFDGVQEALTHGHTVCLLLVTPTGSGKTLASYAYGIRHGEPAFGVYPTNELIRDQEAALRPWMDSGGPYGLLRIDSTQLDAWQDALDVPQHALALEHVMRWEPTILTNPDILFYTFLGLYKGAKGLSQRLFALLGRYRIFIFDEFHLYNVKQMADAAFLAATLDSINPQSGRVLIFASATPESPALPWLRDRLGLTVEMIRAQPSREAGARVTAQPISLVVVPANLGRWRGTDALVECLPLVRQFVDGYPQARLVTILDAVAGAVAGATLLRGAFPGVPVGEVHGFSSREQREGALRSRFTVGTSAIEVGIDFRGETEKDLLIFEARTASQFVQRFGRLGRHEKSLPIPNMALGLVPEYVYNFLASRWPAGHRLSRETLYSLVEEAYQKPEDFGRYLSTHAAVEFHEARVLCEGMFQPDDRPRVARGLEAAISALTGKTGPQARGLHRQYAQERVLRPLLSFRENGLDAAIVDERDGQVGFPIRRYDLMFLLRRGVFTELAPEDYACRLDALASRWPDDVRRERRYGTMIGLGPEDLFGVYGFFLLTGFLDQPRKVWFEVSEEEVRSRKAQVCVVGGMEVATEPELQLRRLNRHVRRKALVSWFVDRDPASIRLGRALPPLFEVYELRLRRPGGQLSDAAWSIAFNQHAFFLDSLGWRNPQREDRAIVL